MNKNMSGESLFLLALCIYLTGAMLSTTMFPIPEGLIKCCRFAAAGLVMWKVICFDCFSWKTVKWILVLVLNVLAVRVFAGYSEPLMWLVFVIGAKDVSFEKILKSYFVISMSVVLHAFAAAMLGVIENLQYKTGNRGIRNAFGILYPTDFAAHIFYMMLVFFCLKKGRVKLREYVLCILLTGFVFRFCNARLDSGCMCLAIVGYINLQFRFAQKQFIIKRKRRKRVRRVLPFWKCAMYSMPVGTAIMAILTLLYHTGLPFIYQVNQWFSNRLSLQYRGMTEYGVRLFGQHIRMVGNGGTTMRVEGYFFIDCSYFYIMMRYGLLFLIIVFVIYGVCCRKYRNDLYFLLAVLLVAVNCMIAHHLLDLAYNPFSLALFAKAAKNAESNTDSSGNVDYIVPKYISHGHRY